MPEQPGTLDFEVKFRDSEELRDINLPVEIRRPNLSLVKTALTSDEVELEPGTYFVVSKMPAGQELFSEVKIEADTQKTVVLMPEKGEEPAREWEAVQHYFVSDRQNVLSSTGLHVVDEIVDWSSLKKKITKIFFSPPVQIRCFSGNLLTDKAQQIQPDWEVANTEKGLFEFRLSGSKAPRVVQLLQTDAPPLNMMMPATGMNGCRLFVTDLSRGKYTLDTHLENQTADMLLRFSNKGYYQQTELLGRAVDAEKLLERKTEDPVSAAVGAYALLRFNKLEMLHDWTENLRNWFEWLPDGSAVRGEHLARLGRHKDALSAFLEIENRGLPIFSDGFSYAIDRLSMYAELKPDSDVVAPSKSQELKNLLVKLQKFALYTDFREPFTTFTGSDVNEPSAEPVKKIVKDKLAFDLTKLIKNQ